MRANAYAVSMPATLGSGRPRLEFSFRTLTLDGVSRLGMKSLTIFVSLLAHGALVAAMVILPLFMTDLLPTPVDAVHAFFVAPPQLVAAPPPPPPPAPAAVRGVVKAPPAPRATEPPKFVAPTVVPAELPPAEEGLELGFEGGVPGGVEGGVPGGVLGGVVGGILPAPQPTPTPVAPLLNGVPTEFILTVTITFGLR